MYKDTAYRTKKCYNLGSKWPLQWKPHGKGQTVCLVIYIHNMCAHVCVCVCVCVSDVTFLSAVQIHNHKASGYHSWYTYEVTGQDNLGFEFGLEKEIFLFSKTSRPTPEHDQPSIQCIPGFFLGGKSDHGMKLTIQVHLVPRLRMSRALPLLSLYGFVAWREKNEHLTA
jgi:hypothetical protein